MLSRDPPGEGWLDPGRPGAEKALAGAVTDQRVVDRARVLLTDPGLAPRDAFHAAHALEAGCELVASSDPDFDRVVGLRRLRP